MDSGYDFLTPELLNVIFFQQKSIVIFPYVDQKHVKALETFAVGHSVIELDCTTLNDIVSIVEHEAGTYSQNPNLYFIYNASKTVIASIHDMERAHCIINTSEDVSSLASGRELLFYNKKSHKFLNWQFEPEELTFERYLFESAGGDATILQDLLLRIKSLATRTYNALVETNNFPSIPIMFNESSDAFPSNWWDRILEFMENYYDINTPPEISKNLLAYKVHENSGVQLKAGQHDPALRDHSSEYELVISTDRSVSNAFIHTLHDYRSNHVNSANLEISQLYNPQELYNYLRNHHWKEGIDEVFVEEWFSKPNLLNETNSGKVKVMLKKLGIPYQIVLDQVGSEIEEPKLTDEGNPFQGREENHDAPPDLPSIRNFEVFKTWILNKITTLEKLGSKD